MAGKAAKVAGGGYGGGRPPFGWRAEGKELVPEPRCKTPSCWCGGFPTRV